MEAMMAMLLVFSAVSFTSMGISLCSKNYHSENGKLAQSIAIYDAAYQISKNASANDCIALGEAGYGPICARNLTESYVTAFGLSRFEVVAAGFAMGNSTKNSTIGCFPIFFESTNETSEVCLIASS
jgi:hypothetical protein